MTAARTAHDKLNNKTIVVAGPTGVGKSSFAVDLAIQIGGEIVCADAFQIYRGMAILTAQPESVLTEKVPHHLFGIVDPSEDFDAARYTGLANQAVTEICARGRTPLLVGGSGLYLDACFGGLRGVPAPDPEVRAHVARLSHEQALAMLSKTDPCAPASIDARNPRRVSRALEIVLQTGRPLADSRIKLRPKMPGVFLNRERSELFQRIEANSAAMLSGGALAEVAALHEVGPTASRAIGFAEIQSHLAGEATLTETANIILRATRRYAKRQLTWFRNQTNLPQVMLSDKRPLHDCLEEVFRIACVER